MALVAKYDPAKGFCIVDVEETLYNADGTIGSPTRTVTTLGSLVEFEADTTGGRKLLTIDGQNERIHIGGYQGGAKLNLIETTDFPIWMVIGNRNFNSQSSTIFLAVNDASSNPVGASISTINGGLYMYGNTGAAGIQAPEIYINPNGRVTIGEVAAVPAVPSARLVVQARVGDPDAFKIINSASAQMLNVSTTGVVTIDGLAGAGIRMVVADASGVLSTQALPSGMTLNNVLGNGNTTGGENIILTGSDEIQIGNVAGNVLRYSGAVLLEAGAVNESIGLNATANINLSAAANISLAGSGFVSIAGSSGINMTGNVSLVSNNLQFQATNTGTLSSAALTAARSWTLPNASGTIALVGSITWADTLAANNSSGGNDLAIANDDDIIFDDNGGGTGPSVLRWGNDHFITYDDQDDGLLLLSGANGIENRSGLTALTVNAGGVITISDNSGAVPRIQISGTALAFDGSLTVDAGLTADRTWTFPDFAGNVAIQPIKLSQAPGVLTTTSTTFQDVINTNTPALPIGDYVLTISYGWNHDSVGNDFESLLLFDGAALDEVIAVVNPVGLIHKQEPQDSFGPGPTGTTQKYGFYREFELTVSVAGVKPILFQFRTDSGGVESSIWKTLIKIERVS